MTSAPILTLHVKGEGFTLYCDASIISLGGVLMQQNGKVVAYSLSKLKTHEKNYPNHDLELVAMVFVQKL